ncbi:MAG: hypothetical protein HY293_23105 [Planctomycetes bacterium]|nr:hypothetical protein [Planctomycetota bacterium]
MKLLLLLAMLAPLILQDEKAIKDKHAEVMAFAKTAKTERDFRAATSDLARLGEQAFGINKYELAAKLYADAEKIARASLKDAALGQQFQESARKASDVGKEFAKASKAIGNIIRNEATPEDYTTSGRFLCFVKGDWELGLADLAKGKDEALKKLAEDDAAAGNPSALAEAWFALIKKDPPAKERALYWYGKAWPQTKGIDREKMRERLTKLYLPAVPGKLSAERPAGWGGIGDKNSIIEVSPLKVHSGGLAMRISTKQPKSKVIVQTPVFHMAAGQKVTVSVWVLSDGTTSSGDSVNFVLSTKTGGGLWTSGATIQPDTYVWTKVSGETICPAESENIRLDMYFASEIGSIWIDDISIKLDGQELFKAGGFEEK